MQSDHLSDSWSKDIAKLYLSESFADVHFLVENEKIPAHKAILAARSEYFRALLFGNMSESYTNEIELSISLSNMKELLLFVYTGEITIPIDSAFDMLAPVNELGFLEIETAITEYFLENLSLTNIVDAFNAGTIYCLKSLENKCKEYIEENIKEIFTHSSFNQMSQHCLKQILTKNYLIPDKILAKSLRSWEKYQGHEIDFINSYLERFCVDEENSGTSINFEFPIVANCLEFVLSNINSSFSIECSNDKADWYKIIQYVDDNNFGLQIICFPTRYIKFVNIIGIDCDLDVSDFHIFYLPSISGLTVAAVKPKKNVALLGMGAISNSNILINGCFSNHTDTDGFATHVIRDNEFFLIRLKQAYLIDSLRLRLWDLQVWRHYQYYIQYSMDSITWNTIVDHRQLYSHSWQNFRFKPKVMKFIKIIGTNSMPDFGNFHVVHFECPSQDFSDIVDLEQVLKYNDNSSGTCPFKNYNSKQFCYKH